MSRIGKMPIPVPSGAKVQIGTGEVTVEGPKGKLSQKIPEGVEIALEEGELKVARKAEDGNARAQHGLARSLLANAVTGVTTGWTKVLEIHGVGYRGEIKEREAHLSLGFSHPVVYPMPTGIEIEIDKSNKITVTGADRQQVGQVAAELRALRPPDPYKGKGIRYQGERLRLKEGKSGVGGG